MKQILAPISGLVTYALGVLLVGFIQLSLSLPKVEVNTELNRPIRVNPCVLSSRSEELINRTIVVDATLYRVDNSIRVYPNIWHDIPVRDCSESDPHRMYAASTFDPTVWTNLNLRNYSGPNANLGELFERERADWEIDVEIEGVLVKHASSKHEARYEITPSKIRLVGAWRRFTPKGAA